MGFFDRFRRNKDESLPPEESDDYYEGQESNRKTAAFLLGLATFLVTLLIGAALFFGGRAIYRAVFEDNGNSDGVVQVDENGGEEQQPAPATENGEEDGTQPGDTDTAPQPSDNGASRPAPQTGDNIPAAGDMLPAAGDPGR